MPDDCVRNSDRGVGLIVLEPIARKRACASEQVASAAARSISAIFSAEKMAYPEKHMPAGGFLDKL